MRKLFVYSVIVFTMIVHTSHADMTSDLQAYPSSEYLVGVSEGPGTVETLMDLAEAQLSKKIFDRVRYVINENEENWLVYNRVREHYGTVIQSSVKSKLKGIRDIILPRHQMPMLSSMLSVISSNRSIPTKLRIYAKKLMTSFIKHKS